jgi:hypothetical protein
MHSLLAEVRPAVALGLGSAGATREGALLRLLHARLKPGNHVSAVLKPASVTVAVPRLAVTRTVAAVDDAWSNSAFRCSHEGRVKG